MSTLTSTDFYAAFHLRQACCQALWELSQRQSELIGSDSYQELLEVLESKQSLIDHLGVLSTEYESLQSAWKSQRDGFTASDRTRCEGVLAQTERLLDEMLTAEQTATQQLLARRQLTQRELQALSAGVQAQLAYQSRPPTVASRLDLDT